ncbi:hypothetical protein AAMO2058_001283800 [Amorphochlora amoebiformis]
MCVGGREEESLTVDQDAIVRGPFDIDVGYSRYQCFNIEISTSMIPSFGPVLVNSARKYFRSVPGLSDTVLEPFLGGCSLKIKLEPPKTQVLTSRVLFVGIAPVRRRRYPGTTFMDDLLLKSAAEGDIQEVKINIRLGADVHARTPSGQTVLHVSVACDSARLINILLRAKADLEAKDGSGRTPLVYAAKLKKKTAALTLINCKASVESQSAKGWSPLMHASDSDSCGIVRALVKAGARDTIRANDESTALIWAAHRGHLTVAKHLIKHAGSNVNCQGRTGTSPLIEAAQNGHLDFVKFLIASRATVDHRTRHGSTALHAASFSGNLKIVKILVDKKATVNLQSSRGRTALISASYGNHVSIVKYLLFKAKADPSLQAEGRTARHWAKMKKHSKVLSLLDQISLVLPTKSVTVGSVGRRRPASFSVKGIQCQRYSECMKRIYSLFGEHISYFNLEDSACYCPMCARYSAGSKSDTPSGYCFFGLHMNPGLLKMHDPNTNWHPAYLSTSIPELKCALDRGANLDAIAAQRREESGEQNSKEGKSKKREQLRILTVPDIPTLVPEMRRSSVSIHSDNEGPTLLEGKKRGVMDYSVVLQTRHRPGSYEIVTARSGNRFFATVPSSGAILSGVCLKVYS